MQAFEDTLEFCELAKLDSQGPRFTWCSGKDCRDFIKERLDRVMANKEWCEDVTTLMGKSIN